MSFYIIRSSDLSKTSLKGCPGTSVQPCAVRAFFIRWKLLDTVSKSSLPFSAPPFRLVPFRFPGTPSFPRPFRWQQSFYAFPLFFCQFMPFISLFLH